MKKKKDPKYYIDQILEIAPKWDLCVYFDMTPQNFFHWYKNGIPAQLQRAIIDKFKVPVELMREHNEAYGIKFKYEQALKHEQI